MLTADVADGRRPARNRMHEYLRGRTAFFDQAVVNSIDSGLVQVVIGGAGYDGRALRYARPGVRWFEVDHPATQADKRERLDRLGIDARPSVHPGRLHRRPDRGTADRGRPGPGRPALFLLEGVAVYLDPPVVERVLAEFRAARPAAACWRSASPSPAPRRSTRARFRERVAALGEPARRSSATTRPAISWRRPAGRSATPPSDSWPRACSSPGPGPLPASRSWHDRCRRRQAPSPRQPTGIGLRVPGRAARLARPPAVGPAVGGAGRVHDRGRQRGRAPPTAPHHQRRPVARRGRRRARGSPPC